MYDYRNTRTSEYIWENVKPKPIFWGWPNSFLFRHACTTNSKMCSAGFTEKGVNATFFNVSTAEWLERINNEARQWDEVLESVLHKSSIAEMERLILDIGFAEDELQNFIKSCPKELQDRINALG